MSTYQDIIDAALLRSLANKPQWSAANAELLQQGYRTLCLCYQLGHLLSPDRWMQPTDLPGGGAGTGAWAFTTPPLLYVENLTTPGEVKVVSVYERTIDVGAGRIYWSSPAALTSVAASGDPTNSDTLRFWSLAWPTPSPTSTTPLDTPWVDQFNGLLVDEMALYLALKDNRDTEVAMLQRSRDQWLQQYVSFLRMATGARASRFSPRTITSGEVQSITSAFLGGGQAA
jgi:hypothetical protein